MNMIAHGVLLRIDDGTASLMWAFSPMPGSGAISNSAAGVTLSMILRFSQPSKRGGAPAGGAWYSSICKQYTRLQSIDSSAASASKKSF